MDAMISVSAAVKTKRPIALYNHQQEDIDNLFKHLHDSPQPSRLLYQLPTGGGKTVVFSEIAKRFLEQNNAKVVILTHRKELCTQTCSALKRIGVSPKVLTSTVKVIRGKYQCMVAMVETLKNRIKSGQFNAATVGLVIVDEAHHNSFHKLLGKFSNACVIGVTATPLSSDTNLPLRGHYDTLITGSPISALIEQGFLAKPKIWRYDVELQSLQTAPHGDFTVSSSDLLYSSKAMLELLLHAYKEHSLNRKTLIFNTGIVTSRLVCQMFNDAGYACKHLDNKTHDAERIEILKWFKKTKGAILTSVSILTTGFDEPTVQSVILNRATNSLTLYHQMIGRGARRLPQKKRFTVIDLGNNTDRFGEWDAPMDWKYIFDHPDEFNAGLHGHSDFDNHTIPAQLRAKFPNSLEVGFDVVSAYEQAVASGAKVKTVLRDSIRQHALMCADNADTISAAMELASLLDKEVQWRVKQYAKCLDKVTKNYTEWLQEDYKAKLRSLTQRIMQRRLRAQLN